MEPQLEKARPQRTLVVDQQCQPLQILPWQRALCLTFSERAATLIHYDDAVIRTVNHEFRVPSVVQMVNAFSRGKHYARFTRSNVLTRDQNSCQYCMARFTVHELTLDHVIPKSLGGKTSWTNIVAACCPCNHRKGAQTPEQAGLVLRRKPVRPLWSTIMGMRGFMCQDPHPSWDPFLTR